MVYIKREFLPKLRIMKALRYYEMFEMSIFLKNCYTEALMMDVTERLLQFIWNHKRYPLTRKKFVQLKCIWISYMFNCCNRNYMLFNNV